MLGENKPINNMTFLESSITLPKLVYASRNLNAAANVTYKKPPATT